MDTLHLGDIRIDRVVELDQVSMPTTAFMEQHADTGQLIIAAHFPEPGRIVRGDNSFRFEVAV